jgi:hypothetical protein
MKKIYILLTAAAALTFTSCSDSYMQGLNEDDTKTLSIDPNSQLTTCLLQTYGDFGLMDTYRSYITGFTQHFAGGWNVSNYAGSVHANDDQMRLIWDQYFSVSIKNLADAIHRSSDKPNLNAVLRIHRVYLLSVLTDTYGDIPCMETGLGQIEGMSNPRYDKQEDIYNFFFKELADCVKQLGTGEDVVTGDVTNYDGDVILWKKYANSLRLRFAMRISDVNPTKAKSEFEAALGADGGYISKSEEDAYIRYLVGPFTLYDGSRDLDFRVNALGEILYGQDPTSPTMICKTFYDIMNDNGDPRLYAICRHYLNTKRSEINPDKWNLDLTDEFLAYSGNKDFACNPGAAWYNNWVNGPDTTEASGVIKNSFPTMYEVNKKYPEAGFYTSNYPARLMRPCLSIDFCQPNRPGLLITSSEVEFLLAEAIVNGWTVPGALTDQQHFENGVKAAIQLLNHHYLVTERFIDDAKIATFVSGLAAGYTANKKEAINTQAWILHMMNPAEAWANLRRSDYPVIMDRNKLGKFPNDFTYDDDNLQTPVRLCYPILEKKYNSVNYQEALDRMGGTDDWHHRVWWDKNDINVK